MKDESKASKPDSREIVAYYYAALRERHYAPIECWGRDGAWTKKFLATGRTLENFKTLLAKALVGPEDIQRGTCRGLHIFMSLLPKIELLGAAPWEPSPEERAANVRLIETATQQVAENLSQKKKTQWAKNPAGGWMKVP
jgi:hypothetical protein